MLTLRLKTRKKINSDLNKGVRYLKDENYKKDLQVIPLEDIKEFKDN